MEPDKLRVKRRGVETHSRWVSNEQSLEAPLFHSENMAHQLLGSHYPWEPHDAGVPLSPREATTFTIWREDELL